MSGSLRERASLYWKAEVEPRLATDPSAALDGIEWKRQGGADWRAACPIHGGDNPDAFALRETEKGWRWKCHSGDCGGGDLAQLYALRNRCGFVEAVGDLALAVGLELPAWLAAKRGSQPASPKRAEPIEPRAPRAPTPRMPWQDQCRAVGRFLELVFEAEYPAAETAALGYLCGVRGLAPDAIARMGGAFLVNGSPDSAGRLRAALRSEPAEMRDLLERAGLARRTDSGLLVPLWHSRAVLLPCARPTYEDRGEIGATDYLFCTARILEPTDKRKYISQATGGGARRPLYGLPSLYRAAELRKPVLIVEGPLDAIGAETLGLHAVATHGRPSEGSGDLLNPWAKLLRKCREVLVLPDADEEPDKRETGAAEAGGLVGVLREMGVRVRSTSMQALGLAGDGIKDLADAAKAMRKRREGEQ